MDPENLAALQQLLASGPPLRLALLFGSQARGTARPDSDLDIAVLPVDPLLALRDELALQADLARLARREVDLVRLDTCAPALRYRVAVEGIPLVSDPVTLSRFRARAAIEYAELAPAIERARALYLRRVAGAS